MSCARRSSVRLALAIAVDAATIAVLYVVAFCIGMAETLYDTSAQSILPQLVDRRLLSRGNGRLYAVELTANEFIGPPLGGFLVTVGAALVMAGSVGVWLVAAGILLLLRGSFRTGHDGTTTIRADVAEGVALPSKTPRAPCHGAPHDHRRRGLRRDFHR